MLSIRANRIFAAIFIFGMAWTAFWFGYAVANGPWWALVIHGGAFFINLNALRKAIRQIDQARELQWLEEDIVYIYGGLPD